MQHHTYLKKHKKKIILPTVLLLILLTIFVVKYLYVPVSPVEDGIKVIATDILKIDKSEIKNELMSISITPSSIKQGEPALIIVEGLTSLSSVKSFTFDNRPLVTFLYNGRVTALLGVDLRVIPGIYPLVLTLNDGRQIMDNFVIEEREMIRAPFDIPEKLGGNTTESEKKLISSLAEEGKIVNAIPTGNEKLWNEKFRSPLNTPLVVTDPYGYTRLTGKSTISHKGTDIEAPIGTSVYAMNRGIVRFTDSLRNYGKTVVIDHGLGLQTVYMHLSEIIVSLGQMVDKGELIGMSGDTGYVLGPHLHLTVRIWDISIDPIKFLELLGEGN